MTSILMISLPGTDPGFGEPKLYTLQGALFKASQRAELMAVKVSYFFRLKKKNHITMRTHCQSPPQYLGRGLYKKGP